MKNFYFSSPIFLLILSLSVISSYNSYGQVKKIDSTTYHYTSIINSDTNEDIIKSILFFEEQLEVHYKKDDPLYRAQILSLISLGQFNIGELFESEITAVESYKALKLVANSTESKMIQISLGNQLGRLYRRLGDTEKAIIYYRKTLELVSEKRDRLILLNNIASIYIDNRAYHEAVNLLIPVIKDSAAIQEIKYQATVFDNYGYSLSRLGQPEGVILMQRAQNINKDIGNTKGLFSTQRHLAEIYNEMGNNSLANYYALEAKKIADELKVPTYRQEALGLLIEVGITKDALAYKTLSDSLKNVRQQEENKYIAQKYDYAQMQTLAKENELIAQKEKSKNRLYQLIVITLILLSIAIVIVSRVLSRKKRMEELFQTEARFSKKIHDEVSNDVYRVMAQIQHSKVVDTSLIDDLESIYSRTRDISKENSLVNVGVDFHTTLTDLFLGYQSDRLQILTKNSEGLKWERISKEKKITIYRVLQELITNTIKHGKASLILIAFTKKGKKINITYKDNGVGGELSDKNGLQNVESRIIAHKGTITFESEKNTGFKAYIRI